MDWEGHIANPAMKYFVRLPRNTVFPAQVTLQSSEPRLYFDLPSEAGPDGPRKSITIPDASSKGVFYVSIFPDRDTSDEQHMLTIQYADDSGNDQTEVVDIHVVDQDVDRPSVFNVTVDFAQDKTGFFDDAPARETIRRAANDWAYFIDEMNLDEVPSGQELTWIWEASGFESGRTVTNTNSYTGFLLYAYGIGTDGLKSGGEPSYHGDYQSAGGVDLPIKRSGGIEIETRGNFNTLGWLVPAQEDDWWRATNLGNVVNDLYSIAHHEMGHSLIFNPNHSGFTQLKTVGYAEDADVIAYHGTSPMIDRFDHLPGAVDRSSGRGAYGNEYHGDVPHGRWLVTKLDLLIAQAVGYALRETSPFAPLSVVNRELPDGTVTTPFSDAVSASGGIPPYHWTLEEGKLPDGLSLDPFTGTVSGTPTESGTFELTLRVREYSEWGLGITLAVTLTIRQA